MSIEVSSMMLETLIVDIDNVDLSAGRFNTPFL
jgi:hypothetical protein